MIDGWLTNWLSGLSLPGVAVAVFVTMLLAGLGGHVIQRLQHRRARRREQSEHSQENYLVGGMLGLLALLLAFSFSLALQRYEERRHLVIDEANAIATSYLRAQLLDEPHRSRLSRLLIDYTDNRIRLGTVSGDQKANLARNDRILIEIWAAVMAARDSANRHGVSTAIFLAFNQVGSLDSERKIARQVRVPQPVLLLLYGFMGTTAAVLGYVLEERRSWIGAISLFILLSLYVGIVVDLNRPTSGNVTESQEPMLMLRQSLGDQPPQVFDGVIAQEMAGR
jgi:hypothetical protein